MLNSFRAVTAAGLALIVLGAGFLYLSDAVIGTGSWWQGTLDAFGVGFIIAGIVDVLAINGLNQVLTGDQQRREINLQAETILRSTQDVRARGALAEDLLIQNGHQLGPDLHRQLMDLINSARPQQ